MTPDLKPEIHIPNQHVWYLYCYTCYTTVDGSEILHHLGLCIKTPVNNGIFTIFQLVIPGFLNHQPQCWIFGWQHGKKESLAQLGVFNEVGNLKKESTQSDRFWGGFRSVVLKGWWKIREPCPSKLCHQTYQALNFFLSAMFGLGVGITIS